MQNSPAQIELTGNLAHMMGPPATNSPFVIVVDPATSTERQMLPDARASSPVTEGWGLLGWPPSVRYVDASGSIVSAVSEFTERRGDDLIAFILAHIDTEEKGWFANDLRGAIGEAIRTRSLAPIGQILGDWEATVEIKLDPGLSRELYEALQDGESQDEVRHD